MARSHKLWVNDKVSLELGLGWGSILGVSSDTGFELNFGKVIFSFKNMQSCGTLPRIGFYSNFSNNNILLLHLMKDFIISSIRLRSQHKSS